MTWHTTPSAPGIYQRFMVDMFSDYDFIALPTMFLSCFGRSASGSKTHFIKNGESVDIDIIRGNEKLSPLRQRGTYASEKADQKDLLVQQFSTGVMGFPLLEEKTPLHAHQLFQRLPGETQYQQMERLSKLRYYASEGHKEHVRRLIRTFEYLAMKSITEGGMPKVTLDESTLTYDWKRNPDHTITTATSWSDAAAPVGADLDTAAHYVRVNGHVEPEYAIFDTTAWTGLMGNTALKALADNRRIDQYRIGSDAGEAPASVAHLIAGGAKYRGMLVTNRGYKLALLTYSDVYTDSSGNPTAFMPAELVVVGSSQARCDRYFGPDERLPVLASEKAEFAELFGFSQSPGPMPGNIKGPAGLLSPDMFMFDAFVSTDRKNVTLRSQAAPIFCTTMTDAWATIKVTQ